MPPRNTAAVGSTIKYRIRKKAPVAATEENPVSDFMLKLKLAWQIFFPEAPAGSDMKPKEEAKQRLRMILVADRCGMSPAGLTGRRKGSGTQQNRAAHATCHGDRGVLAPATAWLALCVHRDENCCSAGCTAACDNPFLHAQAVTCAAYFLGRMCINMFLCAVLQR